MTLLLRVLPLFALLCVVPRVHAELDASQIPQLIGALEDENVRYGASLALVRIGKEAVPALRKSLTSGKPGQQVWSAYTLGEIGADAIAAVGDLTKALENKREAPLRAAAAQALGKIGPEAASSTEALAKRLRDKNPQVRQQAAEALGQIGPAAAKATSSLIAALKDHDAREAARTALIRIGEPAADAAQKALADDSLRFDAATVLMKIAVEKAKESGVDQPTASDLKSLQLVLLDPNRSATERASAAASLATLGADGFAVLISAFEVLPVAETAAAAFAGVGDEAVPLLVEALQHEQLGVRGAAANALGHIGPAASKSVPALVRAMQDQDHDIRYRAVRALDRFGVKAAPAIPDLVKLLHDSSQRKPARQWAIMALVNTHPVEPKAVVEGLIKASQDQSNYGVRQLAGTQVKKLDPEAAKKAGIR